MVTVAQSLNFQPIRSELILNLFYNIAVLTVTHAAPNPVLFYAAIGNFLVLRVRAE